MKNNNDYKYLCDIFPKNYAFIKKINVYIFVLLFLLTIVFLIIATYLNNIKIWYYSPICFFLLFFTPLIISIINCQMTIKKFSRTIYLSTKFNKQYVTFDQKKLYKKGINFKEELIKQAYEQLK